MNKALQTIGFILSAVILGATILYLTGLMEHADNVFMPCLAGLMFVQALRSRKTNSILSLISLLAGVFLLVLIADRFLRLFLL